MPATMTCGAVFDIFDADADTLMLAVTEGSVPVGMVNRYSFLLRFGDRFGRALFEKQPITKLMNANPPIVDANQSVDFLNDIITGNTEATFLRGYIITENGRYYGVGTALSLLRSNIARVEQNTQILNEIVSALPISLTVQDSDGRLLLVNEKAASIFGHSADAMQGRPAYDFMPSAAANRRRKQQDDLLASGHTLTAEESVAGRTLLTSYKPVRVLDDPLFITTALDITERKHSENELTRRAFSDDLTGLPNRVSIQNHVADAVNRCRRSGAGFALVFIDLDNFKQVNDYYSHAVGDALLQAVAQRINKQTRKSDVLARISGDEFLLVLEPVGTESDLQSSIGRVRDVLRMPFQVEDVEILTSASMGISVFPEHGTDYESLCRNADNAMYRAKSSAKGSACFYDPMAGEMLTARMELEQRLRLAVREHQFCCAFQPKVDIRSGRVTGFEALARWCDSSGDMHGPGRFLSLAGELGLMDDITWSVMDAGLAGLKRLDERFGTDTSLSFNVSAQQASDAAFMGELVERIRQCGMGHRLMLELTEDGILGAGKFQDQMLPVLRGLGVKVSIDDFGTGYSSLSMLADITADEIKVDRSFISSIEQRPRNQSVLKAIESLSRALNMMVVAEGVETVGELEYLLEETSIPLSQGYFFARPMSVEDVIAHFPPSTDAVQGTEPALRSAS